MNILEQSLYTEVKEALRYFAPVALPCAALE